MTTNNSLTPILNEQPLSYRTDLAVAEGSTIESLLASATLWEARAVGDDELYNVAPEACLRFAQEDRETAAALRNRATTS